MGTTKFSKKLFYKKQFVFELANILQIAESKASLLFDIFIDLIIQELLKGKRIVFNGFGTFYLHILKPQVKTMPDKRKIITKESVMVRFRSNRKLREKLDKKLLNQSDLDEQD